MDITAELRNPRVMDNTVTESFSNKTLQRRAHFKYWYFRMR